MNLNAVLFSILMVSNFCYLMGQDSKMDREQVFNILTSYVEDFKQDQFASEAMYFGIEIPEIGSWHVNVTGNKNEDSFEVNLAEGEPSKPTFIYSIEPRTLTAINNGEMNALTAQGKAFVGDYTPMSIKMMEGYSPDTEEYAKINPFSFHFWTRGFPEIIPFGEGMTRRAHGSNFVVFYYETGLRTAWYRILPGERVRDDAREQAAPFPMMAISIKGNTKGEVNGKVIEVSAGETVFLPAGVSHKWWNEGDEVVEVILVMFGEGA